MEVFPYSLLGTSKLNNELQQERSGLAGPSGSTFTLARWLPSSQGVFICFVKLSFSKKVCRDLVGCREHMITDKCVATCIPNKDI